MRKLIVFTNVLLEYRMPVYNMLCNYFDVTVAHWGKELVNSTNVKFKQIRLTHRNLMGFIFFNENIRNIAKEYDAVIALSDLHIVPFWLLGFKKKRKFSLTYWGIGVSASYDKMFDEDRKLDKIRFYLMNKADSLVFYSDYPIKRYVEDGGVDRNKLFVANNTVKINERITTVIEEKKYFLFVGTLYKAKKIFDLLDAYKKAKDRVCDLYPLIIIGDGEEFENVKKWISENGLKDKIMLKGAIYSQNELKEYYKGAIACLSPAQAGLTVLNSMAYGVPFITSKNAITGGEIFNISSGVNGIIYEGGTEILSNIITDISKDKKKIYTMGQEAQKYYFSNRTMKIMVDGVKDSIDYALLNKK